MMCHILELVYRVLSNIFFYHVPYENHQYRCQVSRVKFHKYHISFRGLVVYLEACTEGNGCHASVLTTYKKKCTMNATERGKINNTIEMASNDGGYENLAESTAFDNDQQQGREDEKQHASTPRFFANSQAVKQVWSSGIICLLVCFNLGVFLTSTVGLSLAIVLLSGNVGNSHNDCSRSCLGE